MIASNPFHEVYLTETTTPEKFAQIFSPLMVSDTLPLFQSGNVVLMGTQGTGKSALLNLLKPEVRTAYADLNNQSNSFPVPSAFDRFICGGINLTRSGAIDFGQRPINNDNKIDIERLPAFFADFLNYWIVRDLIRSYEVLSNHPITCLKYGLHQWKPDNLVDKFAANLSQRNCWMGYLDGVKTASNLLERLDKRIVVYRSFLNYNIDKLPEDISSTKTSPGEPISTLAETLWSSGLVPPNIPFFVRIDQFEELARLEDWSHSRGLYQAYRTVVHKMLGTRDPRVSYRIGTRRHAWDNAPKMYGTSSVIEESRNFRLIDLDDILRKKENVTWAFPRFAEDVFRRRLVVAGFDLGDHRKSAIRVVFGRSPDSSVRAGMYVRSNPSEVINFEKSWPQELQEYLANLANVDPFGAKLAEAWVRQKSKGILGPDQLVKIAREWDSDNRRWWRKERSDQALMQIAATKNQKLIWSGYEEIVQLSGGNILIFVSICQFIWSGWLRSLPPTFEGPESQTNDLPRITDHYVQNEGIQQASLYWYKKLRADPNGDTRQRFITYLGKFLRRRLLADVKMSYPGETGFTIPVRELDSDKFVERFLFDSAAFGALYDRRHTSKSKSRGESVKWYLNPILCPFFQLPSAHTKEPYYTQIGEVKDWIDLATMRKSIVEEDPDSPASSGQRSLFE